LTEGTAEEQARLRAEFEASVPAPGHRAAPAHAEPQAMSELDPELPMGTHWDLVAGVALEVCRADHCGDGRSACGGCIAAALSYVAENEGCYARYLSYNAQLEQYRRTRDAAAAAFVKHASPKQRIASAQQKRRRKFRNS
jgi:hypothetical protein